MTCHEVVNLIQRGLIKDMKDVRIRIEMESTESLIDSESEISIGTGVRNFHHRASRASHYTRQNF